MKISQILISLKKFVKNDSIQELKHSYRNLNQDALLYYQARFVHCCEWDKGSESWLLEYETNEDYFHVKETFSSYLKTYLDGYLEFIEHELIKLHINLDKAPFTELLTKVSSQLNDIAKEALSQNQDVKTISDTIEDFKEKISQKYFTDHTSNANFPSYSVKIKWLGYLNTLSTFLLDYSSASNNLGKKLFERDIPAFKALMMNGFTDKDGHPISQDTVNTYFDTNKQALKRAKNDIIKISEAEREAMPVKTTKPRRKTLYAEPVAVPTGMDKPSTKSF